jgi:hypothetical protein
MATPFAGRLTLGLASAVGGSFDEQVARARPGTMFTGFHDWDEMVNYDRDARKFLMDWTLGTRDRIRALHFLVTSSFVHMGLTVGNLAVAMNLQASKDRAGFEVAMKRAVDR